jgi:hypothetical protein
MISRTTIQHVSFLIVGLMCQTVLGNEPNDVNEPLRFEMSPLHLAMPAHLTIKPDRRPAYAAGIVPAGSEAFFAWPNSDRVASFLNAAHLNKGLSLAQKEFLEDTEGLLNSGERSYTFLYPKDDPNHPQALLYAMSLADAKRMAQLYLQAAQRHYKEMIDWYQREIGEVSEKIAQAEKRLPDVEKSLETSQKSFDELKALVPYRTEQEATEAIGEFDRMLNAAQVEIAGIRARIEVIQTYQREKQHVEGVAPKLELMFIEEAVAMRGTEARKQMATELRARASRFIDLGQLVKVTSEEKDIIPQNLEGWREDLRKLHERLATIKGQAPGIRDNTVFIYPVGPEPQTRR